MNVRSMGGRLAAVLLGLGLVALIEAGLRLIPVLAPPEFAVQLARVQDQVLHAVNPTYARRFFSGVAAEIPLQGIRMTPRPFFQPVPDDALRVLFAGGSTVQGYPYPKRLSAPSYLQEMLGELYPKRQVEVFNLGITAASSFVVGCAVEDGVAALAPDLVVVYTGHNEFYGVYGAASLAQGGQYLWMKRGHYALMQWRITRLIDKLLAAFRVKPSGQEALIEVMSRAGSVVADDPRREQAVANLEGNLRRMAAFCRERSIPLVICTLISNERRFAPARIEPPLGDEKRERYLTLLEVGGRQLGAPAAVTALGAAEELWAEDAYLHFLRGSHLESLGTGSAARAAYAMARNLDSRPWRAPSAVNEVVRRIAVEEGTLLADVETAFIEQSPAAGVGWELMADHVHPTAAGQILIARSVITALEERPSRWHFPSRRHQALKSDNEYRRHLGDLPVERLAVLEAMASLFGAPPMDRGNEDRAMALRRQVRSLWEQLREGERSGFERWRTGRGPNILALSVAEELFAVQEYAHARDYYHAARLEEPYTIWGDLWSTLRWVRCGQLMGHPLGPAERIELTNLLDRLGFLAQAPDFSPGLLAFIKGYAHHFLGARVPALAALEQAIEDSNIRRRFFAELLQLLVAELMAAGRSADAEKYVVQVATEQNREAFGRALVARIRAGKQPR